MDATERAFFEQNGYLVVKGALSAEHVASCNAMIDTLKQRQPEPLPLSARFHDVAEAELNGAGQYHVGNGNGILDLGEPFVGLLESPAIPKLAERMAEVRWGAAPACPQELRRLVRLDHDYMNVMRGSPGGTFSESGTSRLHGGEATGSDLFHATAVFELCDVPANSGGFAVVPGSHKESVWRKMLLNNDGWRDPPYNGAGHELLECQAGDCIIFSEKVTHATAPWFGPGERRTVFLKFVPHGLHYADHPYTMDHPLLRMPSKWYNEPRVDHTASRHGFKIIVNHRRTDGTIQRYPIACAEDTPLSILRQRLQPLTGLAPHAMLLEEEEPAQVASSVTTAAACNDAERTLRDVRLQNGAELWVKEIPPVGHGRL